MGSFTMSTAAVILRSGARKAPAPVCMERRIEEKV